MESHETEEEVSRFHGGANWISLSKDKSSSYRARITENQSYCALWLSGLKLNFKKIRSAAKMLNVNHLYKPRTGAVSSFFRFVVTHLKMRHCC